MKLGFLSAVIVAGAFGAAAAAQITFFDFEGNAGFGLLPGNEVGAATPVGQGVISPAVGGEVGSGLVFDASDNTLDFAFEFSGLTGGLFNAASGIHFHIGTPGVDPFNETGGIALNLNSGSDPAVSLDTPTLATDGSVSGGTVMGTATLTNAQVDDLFAGNFYLNIHSGEFTGGELRGNLVVVPAPGAAGLLGIGLVAAARRRRG